MKAMKKEEAIKVISVIFLSICVFIKGIQTAIKQEREYNQVLKSLSSSSYSASIVNIRPNPEILLIQQNSLITYQEAEDIYNLSKKYSIPIDTLSSYFINSSLDIEELRILIESNERK
jgi:hypothetical protein